MLYDPKWDLTDVQKNRLTLIALLRDRANWPADFAWNFEYCHSCAIGLAWKTNAVGDFGAKYDMGRDKLEPILGLTAAQAIRIFAPDGLNGDACGYGMPRREVTPEMVADKLEELHHQLVQ